MNHVYLYKLTSGEEIIARSEEIVNYGNINMLSINRPMILQMVPQGDRVGMALMPWMMSAKDDTVNLFGSSILAISKPKQELENSYLQPLQNGVFYIPAVSRTNSVHIYGNMNFVESI